MPEICLLCKKNKVYHIESHLTPAGITENMYGERNKEHVISIDSKTGHVEEYFGRQHPQTGNTTIKSPLNSKKGIFCKKD